MRRNLVLLAALAALALAQSGTGWKIAFQPPAKAKANYDTPLQVKITDAKGAPLEGAEVETILTMVDMDHGEFKHAARAIKPGVYEATAKFIMVGSWQIEVRAKKGGQTASQKFRYELKE
jgi:nitrogen fixation protein FixH